MDMDDIVKNLIGAPLVKIAIPTRQTFYFMECQVQSHGDAGLEARLESNPFTIQDIDPAGDCILSFDRAGEVFFVRTRIAEVLGEGRLRLEALDVTSQPQQRNFFRIDADVFMKFWMVDTESPDQPKAIHEQVNLSGNGLRFKTEAPLEVGQRVGLQISLPDVETEIAEGVGRVVRVLDKEDGVQEVALELVEIEEVAQDRIIRFCLAEQRRQLRMKVRVV